MSNRLNLSSLVKAMQSLKLALEQPKDEFIRDAVIQRFEYTYELCWKMLRRYLMEDIGPEEVNRLSRKDLFRVAADKGLIADPATWFIYHQARNETSHIYDEKKAEQTYQVATQFFTEAVALLSELEQRNA